LKKNKDDKLKFNKKHILSANQEIMKYKNKVKFWTLYKLYVGQI